jgi:iron complex transport system permease protein
MMRFVSFLRQDQNLVLVVLFTLLFFSTLLSIRYGAVELTLEEMWSSVDHFFKGEEITELNERIFLEIRLPRAVLCCFVGASLAVGGSLMQALFRNPIVEPGLIGTSSGAAFGAAICFVLGASFDWEIANWILPLFACVGAVISTFLVLVLSKSNETGSSSIQRLLLTGIAINALFMSGVGFLAYIARDPQARSITFWNLGTLAGANWEAVIVVGLSTIVCILVALRFSKELNALMMGENEAIFLGVHVKQLKFKILFVNVVLVAVATAYVGVIAFVGLIVPHLLRVFVGSDNRKLLWNSAILGAVVLNFTDLSARIFLKPAELPIGIVSSVVGVPIFIYLLRHKNFQF